MEILMEKMNSVVLDSYDIQSRQNRKLSEFIAFSENQDSNPLNKTRDCPV